MSNGERANRPEEDPPSRQDMVEFLRSPPHEEAARRQFVRRAREADRDRLANLIQRRDQLLRERETILTRLREQLPGSLEAQGIYLQYLDSEIERIERSVRASIENPAEQQAVERSLEWYKHLTTLSSGALILVGGFVGSFFAKAEQEELALLSLVSLALAMWGAFSVFGRAGLIGLVDEGSEDSAPSPIWRVADAVDGFLRSYCWLLFIAGIALFVVFATINMF